MTTSGPKETTVKPEIPTLDLSEAQEVPRKKTLTEKVKSLKETVKRASDTAIALCLYERGGARRCREEGQGDRV